MSAFGQIFRDREKLSPRYIPATLPHREEQLKALRDLFWETLDHPQRSFLQVTQLIGDVGTGKTATALRFGGMLETEGLKRGVPFKHVYINPKVHGSARITLYRHLVQQSAPQAFSQNLSAEELLSELVAHLQRTKSYLLITFDEVDYYVKHSKDSIYDLTRLNEVSPGKPTGVLGVIFTARSTKFHEKLDRAELSTLGVFPITFPNYSSKQLCDILEERVKEAFQPRAMTTDVLEYVADIASRPPVRGDVRYALGLLLYSGNLAFNSSSDRVLVEHVRKVVNATHPSITDEDLLNMSSKGKVALLAVVRALKRGKGAYASLREIRTMCNIICEEYGLQSFEDVEEQVQDLADREIVDIKSLTEIGVSGVSAEALGQYLDGLVERIRSGLSGS